MAAAKADGPEVVYYDNGNVKYRGGYLDGEMHGPWEFFRRDGSTMRTGAFDRGKQVGIWRSYDRESIVTRETDFGGAEEDT
jgi:antitoxin component YwqK of YwqJK toxin-antitoxin module